MILLEKLLFEMAALSIKALDHLKCYETDLAKILLRHSRKDLLRYGTIRGLYFENLSEADKE